MPDPTIPPMTSMVASNSPTWRASLGPLTAFSSCCVGDERICRRAMYHDQQLRRVADGCATTRRRASLRRPDEGVRAYVTAAGPAFLKASADADHHLIGAPYPAHSFRQSFHQVSGDEALFAHTLACHITGQTVQVNRGSHCGDGAIRKLRYESCHHSGEDVSRSACRHAGIASNVDPHLSVGLRNQRAMT